MLALGFSWVASVRQFRGASLFLSLFPPRLTFLFLFGFDASSTALGGRPERQDFRVSPRDLHFQNRNPAALLFVL